MSPEMLNDIFNLFVSTKGSRGTGLGLTVSRKILREHGGDIRVTSQPGQGSTFVLEFPLTVAGDAQPISMPEKNTDDLSNATMLDSRVPNGLGP